MSSIGTDAFPGADSTSSPDLVYVVMKIWRGILTETRCYKDLSQALVYEQELVGNAQREDEDVYLIAEPVL